MPVSLFPSITIVRIGKCLPACTQIGRREDTKVLDTAASASTDAIPEVVEMLVASTTTEF